MECPQCSRDHEEHTIKEIQTCQHDWLVAMLRDWADIAAEPPMHEDYFRLNMALLGLSDKDEEDAWITDNIHLDPPSVSRMANERMVAMFLRLHDNDLAVKEVVLSLKSAWLEGMATGVAMQEE